MGSVDSPIHCFTELWPKPMRNCVLVEPEGVYDDEQLAGWIELAMKFVRNLPRK